MSIKYLVKRISIALFTLFLASLFTFILLRSMPGDVFEITARNLQLQRGITLTDARELAIKMLNYNPNEPLLSQLARYYGGILHGNLGISMYNPNLTVNQVVAGTLPWTLFVVIISLLLSFFIGTTAGSIMAYKRKSAFNLGMSIYAIIFSAIPNFIIGVVLLIFLSVNFKIFPVAGAYSTSTIPGFNIPFILDALYHAFLPILTFTLTSLGSWALQMNGSATSILGEDYVLSARARGVSESLIMKKYVKNNALLPLVTSLAMTFGVMMGGATLIEGTFSYPGIGAFIGLASAQRDYTMMQGLLLFTSFCVIVANFIADIIYAKLDHRIKLEG